MALCLVMLAPGWARALPENVAAPLTLTGASTTAVIAQDSGADQLLIVADSANNQLRMVQVAGGDELGTPLSLGAGCSPRDLLRVTDTLYVACEGTDSVAVVDLSAFFLPDPVLTMGASVAVGAGPNRLLRLLSGEDYLIVQNATGKTAGVISLSSVNAPIGINADDSTEAAGSAPTGVRLCGTDADPANRAAPVGLGAGTERIYVGCDDGTLWYFDPFNNVNFMQTTEYDPGLMDMAGAYGMPGEHGVFMQDADGNWSVVDVSDAESGGSPIVQELASPGGVPTYSLPGPGTPRGTLTFFDAETGSRHLAVLGRPSGAQIDLFDIGDLDDEPYVPPMMRDAVDQFSSGLSGLVAGPARVAFGDGSLFVPTGTETVDVILAGPAPSVTGPLPLQPVSALADPDMGVCDPAPSFPGTPLDFSWSAEEPVDSANPILIKSTDSAHMLSGTPAVTTGTFSLAMADVSDLTGRSEDAVVQLELSDAAGNSGFWRASVLVDGVRPDVVGNLEGYLADSMMHLAWDAAGDGGDTPSGARGYRLEITRDGRTFFSDAEIEDPGNAARVTLDMAIEDVVSGEDPLGDDDVLDVAVYACDSAGNASITKSAVVRITRPRVGIAEVFGETGGCTLSRRGGGGLLPPALMVALAGFFAVARRRSLR